MKAATVHEIKDELTELKGPQLINIALRLARFKKENKELLTYLLFEAHDEDEYIRGTKSEIDILFNDINLSHLYFAKKTLRKIVRVINKYSRYSGQKQTDIELRLHFIQQLRETGINLNRNPVIFNIYNAQLKKIHATVKSLHEDLQYDYLRQLDALNVK